MKKPNYRVLHTHLHQDTIIGPGVTVRVPRLGPNQSSAVIQALEKALEFGAANPIPAEQQEPASDRINPDHYKGGGIETIDYLRAKLTPEEFRGFLKGNALKYLSRAEQKGGKEDYRKANWYTTMLAGNDPRKA